MNEPVPLELIHAEIDGELEAHQRAELARALLTDPDARALREGLRRVCTALDGLEAVEPPPQLHSSILAALPASVRPALAQRAAWWSAPAGGWRYAAVAGLLVTGALLYRVGMGRGPDANELAGTMSGSGARTPVVVDSVTVDFGQVNGQVSLQRSAAGLALDLQLNASAPVEVLVAGDGQSLRVRGPRTSVALPGFGAGAQTLDLTFVMAGREIGSARLKIPAER
jgi:hypothetical protein